VSLNWHIEDSSYDSHVSWWVEKWVENGCKRTCP